MQRNASQYNHFGARRLITQGLWVLGDKGSQVSSDLWLQCVLS